VDASLSCHYHSWNSLVSLCAYSNQGEAFEINKGSCFIAFPFFCFCCKFVWSILVFAKHCLIKRIFCAFCFDKVIVGQHSSIAVLFFYLLGAVLAESWPTHAKFRVRKHNTFTLNPQMCAGSAWCPCGTCQVGMLFDCHLCPAWGVFVWSVAAGKYAMGLCPDIYLSVGTFIWTLKIQNSWVKSLEINCQSIFTATLLKLMSIPCHVIQPCGMVLHMMNMQFPFERFQNISSTPSCKRCQAFWWEIYIKSPRCPKRGISEMWEAQEMMVNTS